MSAHPIRTTTARSNVFIRSAAITGLTAACIAATLALPSRAHAAPSLDEQLEAVSAQYKDAKDDLSGLEEDLSVVSRQVTRAEQIIERAPQAVSEATEAVDDTESAIGRLSQLADYSSRQSEQLAGAFSIQLVATHRQADIEDQIAQQKETVADLAEERDDLKSEIEAQEQSQAGESDSGSSGDTGVSVSANGSGAVEFAISQLGKPYVYASAGPDSYDCSGLTMAAWAAAGVSLSHSSSIQFNETQRISRDQLQPGDLVFYAGLGHVGIYAGDGRVIHAPTSGDVVKYSDIDMMSIDGYGRP